MPIAGIIAIAEFAADLRLSDKCTLSIMERARDGGKLGSALLLSRCCSSAHGPRKANSERASVAFYRHAVQCAGQIRLKGTVPRRGKQGGRCGVMRPLPSRFPKVDCTKADGV